ncbi:MAG TPA: hypothetical protein VGM82_03635 [Gemmatimonadaceae bacterium]|jgi:hypothetical protein
MPTLSGIDKSGTSWSIFEIDGSVDRAHDQRGPGGWLCFQRADGHVVRIPRGEYPHDWRTSPIATLLELIGSATDDRRAAKLESTLALTEQGTRLEFVAGECVAIIEDYLSAHGKISALQKLPIDAVQLRGCLTEYVDAARTLGLPPEGAIKQLKEVIGKATRRNEEYRPFVDACIAWAIESYYAQPGSSSQPQADAALWVPRVRRG